MAERVPKKGPSPNSKSVSVVGHACNNLNQGTSLSQGTSPTSPESGSRGNSKSLTISLGQNKLEWVVQDEPGVYVTLSALPGGGNELKRVRFRYHFLFAEPAVVCLNTFQITELCNTFTLIKRTTE